MQLFSEANSSKLLDYHDVVSNEWRFPCSVTLSCLLSQQWSHQSWTWTLTYLGTCVVTRGSLLHCSALLVTSVWWAPGRSSSCVQWDQLLQETICCHHLNIAPVNTWYKSESIMHSEVQRYSTLKLFYCWWLELCCGVSLYLWCYCWIKYLSSLTINVTKLLNWIKIHWSNIRIIRKKDWNETKCLQM